MESLLKVEAYQFDIDNIVVAVIRASAAMAEMKISRRLFFMACRIYK